MAGADDQFRDAGWAAAAVYTGTIGDHQTRLAAVIDTHLRELATRGLLACDPPGGPVATLEEDARWLAAQSGHPRYRSGDGWQHLLEAEPDILIAYRCATNKHTSQPAGFRREQSVRDRLLEHVAGLGCKVGHDQ